MRVLHSLPFTVMAILIPIELSLQFDCLPNGAPIPHVPRSESSPSASDAKHIPARPHSSISSPPHAGLPLRSRSRSPTAMNKTPPTKVPSSDILGYGIDQLGFIRLFSYKNPHRHFELRRYTFPVDGTIELLERLNRYVPVPTQEHIVLSTLDGDVFAILDNDDFLIGLYTCITNKVRAKINIKNGKVTPLTTAEIRESPVGRHRQIMYGYRVEHLNHDHGDQDSSLRSLPFAKPSIRSRSRSSSKLIAIPNRLPSSGGSGYELDQLDFIRLIPKMNRNQMFALRRYTFPVDKPIVLYHGRNLYGPIQTQELIVLSTLLEDVLAILESCNTLAGIYTYNNLTSARVRAKINMQSRMVTQLTKHELEEVPVGRLRTISNNFMIQHTQHHPKLDLINEEGCCT